MEMMWRMPGYNQREFGIREWKIFSRPSDKLDVLDVLSLGSGPSLVQHSRGYIEPDHSQNEWRQRQRRVPRPGGNIKRQINRFRSRHVYQNR
jgi:hypothetical protein